MQKSKRKIALILIWVIVVPVFVVSQISFYWDVQKVYAEEPTTLTQQELAAQEKKEKEIEDAKEEAEDLQKKIDKENKAKALLEKNLGQIQSAVFSTQKAINTTKSVITETDNTISRKEKEIQNLSDQIILQQQLLKDLIQQAYYIQNQPILNMVFMDGSFSDLLSGSQHLSSLDEKILGIVEDIGEKKVQIDGDKIELAKKKEAHLEVLATKTEQKQELVADQIEVQEDIESKEAIIAKLQKQLTELQGDLNILTGKSYNAKNIRDAVEDASSETGVPEGVLYGFLKMETNLGANTGQCTYKEVEKVSIARYKKYGSKYKASIALLYKRQDLFYDLVSELGYSKDKKVSCSPSAYVGQGGAMGVPQFMSDVWNGYASQIATKTGHSIPDPWSLTDGVMAMALKLKKAGATSSSASVIKKASISYLGTYNANYYNGIVYWSKNYKLLFD
ncbi:MAG: hypothetical protein HGA61_01990 [Candidatus Moranbacteria bacterium]|nr:hypothetical protein [Candidatus Moranbacteria bacterium]